MMIKRKKFKTNEQFLENIKVGDILEYIGLKYWCKAIAYQKNLQTNRMFSIFVFSTNDDFWKNQVFHYNNDYCDFYLFQIISNEEDK